MLPNTCNFVVSEPRDRCIVVRLAPGNVARFKVIFTPTEIGKHHGKIRLHVIDNPYENMSTNLEGECYVEPIVLDGLQFEENKRKLVTGNHKVRRVSSKQNSLVSGERQFKRLYKIEIWTIHLSSISFKLRCFINHDVSGSVFCSFEQLDALCVSDLHSRLRTLFR